MIEEVPMEWLVGINNFFKTNEVFSPTMVAIENDVNMGTMATLQASLSSIGLLGYNLTDSNYFYRRLPFKPQRLISLNPRLQNAKKLTENNEVQIVEQRGDYVKANVKGTGGVTPYPLFLMERRHNALAIGTPITRQIEDYASIFWLRRW